METKLAKLARNLNFEARQYEFIAGSLLGDGYLDKTTRGYALRIHHGIAQKDYVDFRYQLINEFCNSRPKQSKREYYFRTVCHNFFDELHKQFYQGSRKILAKEFLEKFLSPFALAIWIMDDGSKDYHQMRINSQSFTLLENIWLIEFLQAKLGIEATLNVDKGKYRLRVRHRSMPKLLNLIRPYFIPSMLYKLPS